MLKTTVKELFFELMNGGITKVLGTYEELDKLDAGTCIFCCKVFDEDFMFVWCNSPTHSILVCTTAFEIEGFEYIFRLYNDNIEFVTEEQSYIYRFDKRPFIDFDGFDMDQEICYKLIQGFKQYIDGYFIK